MSGFEMNETMMTTDLSSAPTMIVGRFRRYLGLQAQSEKESEQDTEFDAKIEDSALLNRELIEEASKAADEVRQQIAHFRQARKEYTTAKATGAHLLKENVSLVSRLS